VGTSLKAEVFGCLLIWTIQVCINTMPMRKDIDIREAINAAHQSGKGYKTKLFEVHHSTKRNIILK